MAYKIRIKMSDGEKIEICNVTNHEWYNDLSLLKVEVDTKRQFFNINHVMYVGRVSDLEANDSNEH